MASMATNSNTTGLPDLTSSNAGMRGMGSMASKASANVPSTFKVATSKKHQTHPKKGTKISVPPGQKYTAAQTQGAPNMGVGGAGMHMQVQGMQGGLGALAGAQQATNNQRLGGGKYGGPLNMNMALTSTKYQGGGAAAAGPGGPGGLSVGPTSKGGPAGAAAAAGAADDKGGKYTSPYSQKYITTRGPNELDP